jgi:hypothetical protein
MRIKQTRLVSYTCLKPVAHKHSLFIAYGIGYYLALQLIEFSWQRCKNALFLNETQYVLIPITCTFVLKSNLFINGIQDKR